nr:hypothetical protein [Tanacetum cinerariifolium]
NFMPPKLVLTLSDEDEYVVSESATNVPAVVTGPFDKFIANKNNNFNEKVNTVRGNITTAGPRAVVSDDKGNKGNPQLELQEKGVIDNGCSRHMTGNMSYLSEYAEIDGGYVAFGGDLKGGKITGKGKISIDTECVVLSPDFKLLDESQVLLRVPRKNNMYSVDLKNVAPSRGKFYQWDEMCGFGKAIDNDPDCVMFA